MIVAVQRQVWETRDHFPKFLSHSNCRAGSNTLAGASLPRNILNPSFPIKATVRKLMKIISAHALTKTGIVNAGAQKLPP